MIAKLRIVLVDHNFRRIVRHDIIARLLCEELFIVCILPILILTNANVLLYY